MGLLRADLQALANGFRTDGRAALIGRFAPPVVLAAMHWMLGAMLLQHRHMLSLLDNGGDPLAYLFGHALAPGPVVAGWIGFALAQRQLFEAPELVLWQSAPIRRGRAALQVLLRAAATAVLWASGLCLPLLVQMLLVTDASPGAWVAVGLAVPSVVLPPLCFVLALQILLLSLARGAWTRLVLSTTSALAAFGFPVFLLAQVFFGGASSAQEVVNAAQRSREAGRLTGATARLLANAVDGTATTAHWFSVLAPTALMLALILAVAPLHAGAVQNHELARAQRPRRRSRWPAGPIAVLRRKEFAQILQQPGALVHMLLVGAMVHVFAAQGTFIGGFLAGDQMPPELRQVAAMTTLWFLAVLMLLYTHMGRFSAADGAQWPLYLQAPLQTTTLLFAKLQSIAVLMTWPLLLSLWAGVQWLDAGMAACVPFVLLACAGSMIALATVATVGTWPWLVRPEIDGRLSQGSRGLVGSVVLVFSFYFAVSPAFFGWIWLLQRFHHHPVHEVRAAMTELWPPILLIAFGLGGLLMSLAVPISRHHYARLLAPR